MIDARQAMYPNSMISIIWWDLQPPVRYEFQLEGYQFIWISKFFLQFNEEFNKFLSQGVAPSKILNLNIEQPVGRTRKERRWTIKRRRILQLAWHTCSAAAWKRISCLASVPTVLFQSKFQRQPFQIGIEAHSLRTRNARYMMNLFPSEGTNRRRENKTKMRSFIHSVWSSLPISPPPPSHYMLLDGWLALGSRIKRRR